MNAQLGPFNGIELHLETNAPRVQEKLDHEALGEQPILIANREDRPAPQGLDRLACHAPIFLPDEGDMAGIQVGWAAGSEDRDLPATLRDAPGHAPFQRGGEFVVETYPAEELGVAWGREVGCKIRFNDETTRDTVIKFLTDGMLLAEVQGDPLLREYDTVIIDEIQKIPELLDIIQSLIESRKIRVALTGSSARKLKCSGANLLGGRAWVERIFPFTLSELGERFELQSALHWGTLPLLFDKVTELEKTLTLNAYVDTYIKEEIREEQVVRKLDPFLRFLEVAAQMNGRIINATQIGLEGSPCSNSTHTPAPIGGTIYTPIGRPVGPATAARASRRSHPAAVNVRRLPSSPAHPASTHCSTVASSSASSCSPSTVRSPRYTSSAIRFSRVSASKIDAGSAFPRQTWAPPTAVIVHTNVQPFAWNIGSVQR